MEEKITIGTVANQAGVNVETIRYYERRGLVSPHARRDSGYRLYTMEAVERIRFIKNAQGLGFTLKEIAGLLRLRISHRARCHHVKQKAIRKLWDVEDKLRRLQSIKRVLRNLVRVCNRRGRTGQCPILKSLEA